ncbi:MAG: glycosyltransferase [Ignavibacteria bacterium]|nr:glycosyltransferase [Ignavibacteria bacterium]
MTNIPGKNNSLISDLPLPPKGKSGWPWTDEFIFPYENGKKEYPRITIVTPSFNQGKFIEQTIRSVILQNYPNLEYIIMDGGSTDETVEIIKKYDRWISHWVSEKDKGQSDAINKGIGRGTGEIFNWINSDDYYSKDTFQKISETFVKSDADIIVGNYRYFEDENENKSKDSGKTIDFRLRETLEETIAFVLLNQPSSFFKLNLIKELGGLNVDLNFVMDQDLWKKYLFRFGQNNVNIIDSMFTHFRLHSDSKTFMNEFNNEYMNIYYSIAVQTDMTKQAGFLKSIYGKGFCKNYKFSFELTRENLELSRKVINSLIYFKARIAFTTGDIILFKKCKEVIDPIYLNKTQRSYLRRIKIKSLLMDMKLNSLLNLWRSLTNKKVTNYDGSADTELEKSKESN